MPTTGIMNLATVLHDLRCSLLRIERCLLQVAGLDRQLGEFTHFGLDSSEMYCLSQYQDLPFNVTQTCGVFLEVNITTQTSLRRTI